MVKPFFRDLIPDEIQFVEASILLGHKICNHYLSDDATLYPDLLDQAYEAWASDIKSDKPTPEDVCHGLGALLGNYLVSNLKFSWVMAIDSFGTDYSVRHPDSWQSFPFDFVAKRIQDGETEGGFFKALYGQLEERQPAEPRTGDARKH
jgi:hypothetical protein